jgi:N-acetylmuramoyl-L-alanine amidase
MKKIIVIDPGHGGHDPGACGNGLQEKEVVLDIAKQLRDRLELKGFHIIMTRSTDTYVMPGDRATIANKNKADLFISLHCNADTSYTATGMEVLVYKNYGDANRIASYILNELRLQVETKDRGVKERPDLAVLNATTMIAVLVEFAFITTAKEAALLRDKTYRECCAGAVTRAVCQYFGVDASANVSTPPAMPEWKTACIKKLVAAGIITTPDAWGQDASDDRLVGALSNMLDYMVDYIDNKFKSAPVPKWQQEIFDQIVADGKLDTPEFWAERLGEHVTIGEMFAALYKR